MAVCMVNGSVMPPNGDAWTNSASMCVVDGNEDQLYDYRLMNHTVATLARVAAGNTPWSVLLSLLVRHCS